MDFDELDREEVDRSYDDCGRFVIAGETFLREQACPSLWRITQACNVGTMAKECRHDRFIDTLGPGSLVRVLEMAHVVEDQRVYGRIDSPQGWIPLLNTWNDETMAERLEDTSPGIYLMRNKARVTSTLTLQASQGCKDICNIYEETLVRVFEIELTPDERRVRARIKQPCAGWISVLNLDNGYRWAERRPDDTEVPLLSFEGVHAGAALHLLSDPEALAAACEERGGLTPEQCMVAAGGVVTVLQVDIQFQRIQCRVPIYGEVWLAIGCFAHVPEAAEDTTLDQGRAAVEAPEPPRRRLNASARRPKEVVPRDKEVAPRAVVQAPLPSGSWQADLPPPPEPPQPTEAEAQALAALLRGARAPPAAPRAPEDGLLGRREAPAASPAPAQPAAKEVYTLEDFPVDSLVEVVDSMALRQGERSSSKELLRLDKGWQCIVLEHSAEAGSRRMRVREEQTHKEGWISCATKAGRPLVAIAVARAAEDSREGMPSVDEVLAMVDEDESIEQGVLAVARAAEAEDEPDDPVLQLEKAEEAIAVWRGFKDLARLDTAEELRGIEGEALAIENYRHEQLRWGGWDNPSEEQVAHTEDRRLRLMEAQLLKREEHDQKFKDRLQRAMAASMSGPQPMPKARAIVRRNAPEGLLGSGGGASSSRSMQRLAIEDMRQQLEEERHQRAEMEAMEARGQAGLSVDEVIEASRRRAAELEAAEAPGGGAEEWEATERREDFGGYGEPLIEPGVLVQVHSLKGAAELNDLEGMVERWDEKTERWVVRLQNGQCKKLREQNLFPCEAICNDEEPPPEQEAFGAAPFAVSMRNGQQVAPPKGDITKGPAGGAQGPWYAPWMAAGE